MKQRLLVLGLSVALLLGAALHVGNAGVFNPAGSSTSALEAGITKALTWANSLANAFRFGDGVTPWCAYTDATLGPVIRPCTLSNTRTFAWTDFLWSLFDVEGNRDIITVDPDAFGTGSGTVTLNSSEQLVASNLGVEATESDTNPTCASGNYTMFADTSDATWKYCNNGVTVPLPTLLYKSSNETVSASTALQNDDVFVVPVVANAVYEIHMYIRYSSAVADDFKYTFTLPASAVGEKSTAHTPLAAASSCSNTSTTTINNDITQTDANVGGGGTGAGNICSFVIDAVVVVAGTAGNVTFQWAQVASGGTTTVHAGSYLTYRRIQ